MRVVYAFFISWDIRFSMNYTDFLCEKFEANIAKRTVMRAFALHDRSFYFPASFEKFFSRESKDNAIKDSSTIKEYRLSVF